MREVYYNSRDGDYQRRLGEIKREVEEAFSIYKEENREYTESMMNQRARLTRIADQRVITLTEEGSYKLAYKFEILGLDYARQAIICKVVLRGRGWSDSHEWAEALARLEVDRVVQSLETMDKQFAALPVHQGIEWFESPQAIRSSVRRGSWQAMITEGNPDQGLATWDCRIFTTLAQDRHLFRDVTPEEGRKFHTVDAAKNWAAARL